ncbi:multidrug effflux MFS transporter [Dictyobacter arantiisoli]|uniref:Bcr/CflA family drug resistance efflux transporter n=1 Tax=Dictyobacter arantiisoli TaxID=2014874 RepID=A0A5A5TJ18_9CHLR|nr:multidrug effflux MFS transporter [Dictyobacter arantiisoli]GCF11116.1 Bcr/CflA family drug resistance efflux transporter [Dictyobacter arantiisoli]
MLILGGLTAFAPLSTDMYLPSLPAVSHDLSTTMSLTQITLTACILGLSLGQIIVGPISDARGRRWPLLIGIAVYVLASLLCIAAPSVAVLSLLRFVQGLAGAAGIVIAFAIARDLYAGSALVRCLSLLMTVNFLAPIVAPVLGGQLLSFTSWRGVFVALALLGIAALLASTFGLSETLETSRRQSGGILVTLQSFRGLLLNKRFVGYALSSSFVFAAAMIYISISPFVLENIYGLSPQLFGLLFGINALGLASMSLLSAKLVNQVSPQRLLTGGVVAFASAGLILLVVVITGIGLVGVLPLLFLLVASLGFIMPNAPSGGLRGGGVCEDTSRSVMGCRPCTPLSPARTESHISHYISLLN